MAAPRDPDAPSRPTRRSLDAWDPRQYDRFKAQRQQPYVDLLALIVRDGLADAVDLGCGSGELTASLHADCALKRTLGVDSSASMLERARDLAGNGLDFEQADVAAWLERELARTPVRGVDLAFSNAALQWLDDHRRLFPLLAALVRPGGQIAVQMPANHDHRSHRLAVEIAGEAPFVAALGGYARVSPVLPIEDYATLLHAEGFREQTALVKVYGHPMASSRDVVEWVKGTLLTDYKARLTPELYAAFEQRYAERLVAELGDGPYFYAFKRLLLWGRK
jgi:trans-aconitate 2-methyltransferase